MIKPKNKDTIRALIISAQHWDRNCIKFEGDSSDECALCTRFQDACTHYDIGEDEDCPLLRNNQWCNDNWALWSKQAKARKGKKAARPHYKAMADFLWSMVPDEYLNERVSHD